ncbi:hypothetical protein ANN_19202 [Periplaneta americana]|uniref:Uncharacterized protein n=1 Tax=Periplaneta americana TaxID=6978 RepID=A0ABQ8S9K6_PERAM|nr:hypothetical protein ANN_19202 [Periplaneta americana]
MFSQCHSILSFSILHYYNSNFINYNALHTVGFNKISFSSFILLYLQYYRDWRLRYRYICHTFFISILDHTEIRLEFSGQNSDRNPVIRTETIRPSGRCSIYNSAKNKNPDAAIEFFPLVGEEVSVCLKKIDCFLKIFQGKISEMTIFRQGRKYIKEDARLKNNGRPIVYLDETWIDINHTKRKIWVCDDGDIPLNVPLGKGGLFIIVHAGSSSEFIPGAYHSFKSKSANDPHEEMNAVNSKHSFENKLLPNIPQHSIIVMGNASYHSVQLNKAPTSASSKSDMQSWLRQNNIEYDPKATKIVLYDIIKF